jgi:hypothetical protein
LARHGLKHFRKNLVKDEIAHENEHAEQEDNDANQDGGAFQFSPCGPRASAGLQFLPRFLEINGQARDIAFPPKEAKECDNDGAPNNDRYQTAITIHKKSFSIFPATACTMKAGGEGGIRTPVGR